MRLYHSPTTPFGRKIMVQILETGLEVEVISVMGTPIATGTLPIDRNPLGKIPALELDDGGVIYDSRVISRYLDDLTAAGLYPAKPALWDVLVLEATTDGILDAAVLMAYEVRIRPEERRFPEWVEGQWAKIARSLDAIEAKWMAQLAGPLNMAQIGLGCGLAYLDFRHGPRNWREERPTLAEWEARFAQRPSMLATQPPAQ
ncbi:MAG: glutathione S-transferase family protein [Paracoccaceae bacterium]